MKHSTLITIFVFLVSPVAFGQSHKKDDSLLIKVKRLKAALDKADTLNPEEMWSDTTDVNGTIFSDLANVLTTPSVVNYNLDSLLSHGFLNIVHSTDKRLWIFNWYENTGGSFKSNITLIHYRTKENKPRVANYPSGDIESSLCLYGANFEKIHKLSDPSRSLYLCMGSEIGCNTCCSVIAGIIELTDDDIIFGSSSPGTSVDEPMPSTCFTMDSRCGDIYQFDFDTATEDLLFSYTTDDMTPISTNEEKSQTVTGTLHFNGDSFVESDSVIGPWSKPMTKLLTVQPGGLFTALTPDERDSITILILKGTIDARDFRTMREKMPSLQTVDLGDVNIAAYKGKDGTYGGWIYGDRDTTYPANVIPSFAFLSSYVRYITLPRSAIAIGDFAFHECGELLSLRIYDKIKSTGQWTFFEDNKLDSVIFPNSLTVIDEHAFDYCRGLTFVKLPSSLTAIKEQAFGNCEKLQYVKFPRSLKTIENHAFYNCTNLDSVYIPSTVNSIGKNAFEYCGCYKATIACPTVGAEAFANSPNLVTLNLATTVTKIGEGAFYGCDKLSRLNFNATVTAIDTNTFSKCKELVEMVIPQKVKSIYYEAFCYCDNLGFITIPASVTNIARNAFYCPRLQNIILESSTPPILAENSGLASHANCTLYVPKGAKVNYQASTEWAKLGFPIVEGKPK